MPDTRSASAPTIAENVIVLSALLLFLEETSRLPTVSLLVVLIGGAVIFGVGVAYIRRIAIQFAQSKRDSTESRKPRVLAKWAVFPAAVALMISSEATHWPAALRFHFSKSSFENLVTQAHQGKQPEGFPRWVGLYWVESIRFDSSDADKLGFVTGTALIDPCGIEYDMVNPPASHWLTTRIARCWYLREW